MRATISRVRYMHGLTLLMGAILSIIPLSSMAQITCPVTMYTDIIDAQSNEITCDIDATLNILSPDGSLSNLSTLTRAGVLNVNVALNNYGDLYNRSVINNYGTLYNYADFIFFPGAPFLGGNSRLYNYGFLYNLENISGLGNIYNIGTFYNSGGMNVGIWNSGASVDIYNLGTLFNSGTMNAFKIDNSGVMHNSGEFLIDSIPSYSSYLINHNIINNDGNMRIEFVFNSQFAMENYGTINNNGNLTFAGPQPSYNYGVLNITGTLYNFNSTLYNADGTMYVSENGVLEDILEDSSNQASFPSAYHQTDGSTVVDGRLTQRSVTFSGGTFGGRGTVTSTSGPISIGADASINPGNTIVDNPTDFTANLTLGSDVNMDGSLIIEIADLNNFDSLTVQGAIDFGTTSEIIFDLFEYTPGIGDQYDFLFVDELNGFDNISYSFADLPQDLRFDVLNNNGTNLSLLIAPIPEPTTYAMMAMGLAGIGFIRKRKQKS